MASQGWSLTPEKVSDPLPVFVILTLAGARLDVPTLADQLKPAGLTDNMDVATGGAGDSGTVHRRPRASRINCPSRPRGWQGSQSSYRVQLVNPPASGRILLLPEFYYAARAEQHKPVLGSRSNTDRDTGMVFHAAVWKVAELPAVRREPGCPLLSL